MSTSSLFLRQCRTSSFPSHPSIFWVKPAALCSGSPLTHRMTSRSFSPAADAGLTFFPSTSTSQKPTTVTPSVINFTPNGIPPGVTVKFSSSLASNAETAPPTYSSTHKPAAVATESSPNRSAASAAKVACAGSSCIIVASFPSAPSAPTRAVYPII